MSRHHKTGEISARTTREQIAKQVAKAMYDTLEDAEYNYMSEQVTIIHYCAQYASVAIEELADHFDGNNCEFTLQAQKKGKVAVLACNAFTDYFEPLIHPDNKKEWADEYGQFQYALSNFLNKDRLPYQKGSDAERAKEICRAAALRYHDPMETNLQRTFEAGFREGAAYADLHPLDSITILDNGVKKRVTLKELAEAYTGKSDIIVELNAKKP
jgi:hypothetical protein